MVYRIGGKDCQEDKWGGIGVKNCWVLFMTKNWEVASTEARFPHFPPTANDIRVMQKELREKYNTSECIILNWKELTEE